MRRLSAPALIPFAILIASSSFARAEFRGKGSAVGRFLSESVAEAEAEDTPEPKASPISPEELAAIMKHPTEPVFDPLRPLSGRWVRCRRVEPSKAAPAEPAVPPEVKSQHDLYSSSDRSHLTHTVLLASDDECKAGLTETRTKYECSGAAGAAAGAGALSCKPIERATRKVGDAWKPLKLADTERSMSLSLVGANVKSKRKSKSKKDDAKKLELRIGPEGGSAEIVKLEFEPASARAHKTND